MPIAVITGSGSEMWPRLTDPTTHQVQTRYGSVDLTTGRMAGVDVVHLSRHGPGHTRLSHHVTHRANLAALKQAGVAGIVSLTVCGAVDPTLPLGTLIAFDDLYFPSNRLPDGSLCTMHNTPGAAGRGHWIFDTPISEPLRTQLVHAATTLGTPIVDGGCYGHVDGPRFNSRTEIAASGQVGVSAISQTAGPKIVLAGEAEIPIAVLGYVTDHANGVRPPPQPLTQLAELMAASTDTFAAVLEMALPHSVNLTPAGVVYRFTP